MKLTKEESKLYHSHTLRNRHEIDQSEYCSCISCCNTFPSPMVMDFIKDGDDETALCPNCGIDAVIGDGSGLEINGEILKILNKIWF